MAELVLVFDTKNYWPLTGYGMMTSTHQFQSAFFFPQFFLFPILMPQLTIAIGASTSTNTVWIGQLKLKRMIILPVNHKLNVLNIWREKKMLKWLRITARNIFHFGLVRKFFFFFLLSNFPSVQLAEWVERANENEYFSTILSIVTNRVGGRERVVGWVREREIPFDYLHWCEILRNRNEHTNDMDDNDKWAAAELVMVVVLMIPNEQDWGMGNGSRCQWCNGRVLVCFKSRWKFIIII